MDPTPASNGGWSVSCGWHSITSLIQPQMNCVIFIKETFLPEDEVDVEEEEESRHAKGHLMTSNYVFIQDLFPWFTGPLTLSVHSLSSPLTFDLWPIL